MKARGERILKQNANYYDMLRYEHFCYEKLIEAGYNPQGWDKKTDTVCVMKFKNPNETWNTEGRKIYHFDSFIDAAENLIGITEKDFDKDVFEIIGKLSKTLTKEEYKMYLQRKENS